MSGVHRFLSRRERKHTPAKKASRPDHFGGVFTLDEPTKKKSDKEEDKKIKAILARLQSFGIESIVESNVDYALRHASPQGDPDCAFRLLMLLEETYEGIVRPYAPDRKLLGAVNREGVTCYLDALLFAMFARLDSFEAMLYDNFDDHLRKKLAGMLRLWVNLLRTGKLISIDITKHLQEALAACDWPEATSLKQQDPSEAFGFITGKLELPLLTLKMDLYHTGKEDPHDDHKFINERLLEVAILDEPPEGSAVITLEDCLEHYFNNRIEVKRHLENQRRNTLKGNELDLKGILKGNELDLRGALKGNELDLKGLAAHVQVAELADPSESPRVQTPVVDSAVDKFRPSLSRARADSIFSQRRVQIVGPETLKPSSYSDSDHPPDFKDRKMSTRTEVLMPAWQFFKLLPWYTDHMPTSDAQVAAHFSKKRPVLGICLKRYSYTNTGQARRLDTFVDIPLEIAVPNFVSDDNMQDEGPLVGNFRLVLQSVVCHRGISVNSGHYIALSRGRASNAQRNNATAAAAAAAANDRRDSDADSDIEDPWMRFDDMAKDRISYVEIHQALKEEMPYLLFYQVQPIGDDGHSIHDLPSYAEATSRAAHSDPVLVDKPDLSASDLVLPDPIPAPGTNATDWASASERTSLDAGASGPESERGRFMPGGDEPHGRRSIAFDGSSVTTGSGGPPTDAGTNSVPPTPPEDKTTTSSAGASSSSFLSVIGSRRNSRPAKSRTRTASAGPPESGRFSLNMAKLTARMSRADMAAVVQPSEHVAAELAGQTDVAAPAAAAGGTDRTADEMEKNAERAEGVGVAVSPLEVTEGDIGKDAGVKPLPKERRRDKDKAVAKQGRKVAKLRAGQEDRDCVVM